MRSQNPANMPLRNDYRDIDHAQEKEQYPDGRVRYTLSTGYGDFLSRKAAVEKLVEVLRKNTSRTPSPSKDDVKILDGMDLTGSAVPFTDGDS